MNSLDDLLGADVPHATFHDARIVDLTYDPATALARATLDLSIGNLDGPPAAREQRRLGRLTLDGITLWRLDSTAGNPVDGGACGVWLVSEGPLADAGTPMARELAHGLSGPEIAWYFYFADTNRFLYWAAQRADFAWLPPTPDSTATTPQTGH